MRIIEKRMVEAIRSGKSIRCGNTEVCAHGPQSWSVYLHGNHIARASATHAFEFTLAGWPTATTRSRINALLRELGPARARVYQQRDEQFYTRDVADSEETFTIGSDVWVHV